MAQSSSPYGNNIPYQNPWSGQGPASPQGYQTQRPAPARNPWLSDGWKPQTGPVSTPPQGFGSGGYPQAPGYGQQPPWMSFMQQPQQQSQFGAGMPSWMNPSGAFGSFLGQQRNPFTASQYAPPTWRQMPQLPTVPTPNMMPGYSWPGQFWR